MGESRKRLSNLCMIRLDARQTRRCLVGGRSWWVCKGEDTKEGLGQGAGLRW